MPDVSMAFFVFALLLHPTSVMVVASRASRTSGREGKLLRNLQFRPGFIGGLANAIQVAGTFVVGKTFHCPRKITCAVGWVSREKRLALAARDYGRDARTGWDDSTIRVVISMENSMPRSAANFRKLSREAEGWMVWGEVTL